jgi:CheY-like chemotaxis protein
VTGSDTKPGLKVLVADDNRDAADTLAALLGLWGYEVRVAYEGAEAFRAALADVPDCLISDISMPGLDGYALARRVRAEPRLARVRLIALSGFSDDAHARAAHEAGFEYRLVKPANPSDLLEVLQMIEQIKELAAKTRDLAEQNVELAGETRDLLKEVKQDVKEVKQEVKELKKDVEELKKDRRGDNPAGP